jgi:hypothetical protein
MSDIINLAYDNTIKMFVYDTIKTNNPAINVMLSTIMIAIIGFISNYLSGVTLSSVMENINNYDLMYCIGFKRPNTITLEGKFSTCGSGILRVTSHCTDRFKAISNYIVNNIDSNKTIHKIKEYSSNFVDYELKAECMLMVSQKRWFSIGENIFARTITQNEDTENHDKTINRCEKITIEIYSYIYPISFLKSYVDSITTNYLCDIQTCRIHKRFIYNLTKTTIKEDQTRFDCWDEYEFESTRTFKSLFFDGKEELVEIIKFFLNNKDWYCKIGIPYSLGIGLHGPPGTGKTSLIKSISNCTNRDIVVISLKLIKTKSQLEQFFFENTYNRDNKPGSKSFDKKIIVFEDIDCIGDIVLNRDTVNHSKVNQTHVINRIINNNNKDIDNINNTPDKADVKIKDVFKTMDSAMYSKLVSNTLLVEDKITSDDKITLDDILNIWDGIRETPGRILIMTSNHYHELDPALIRPGRIDISHEMKNASHKTIRDLHEHLFNDKIDEESLLLINEFFYSPAELINIYIYHNDANRFVERLLLNQKV